MMSPELYKFVEQCLREYHENIELLDQRRWDRDHLPMFADGGGERVSGGDHPDPVFMQLSQLEDLDEEIVRLESRVAPIERGLRVIERKRPQLLPLLGRYFDRRQWKDIGAEIACSRSNLDRLRNQLIGIFGRLLLNSWRNEGGWRGQR